MASESFAYMAIKLGIGTINGNRIYVGRTADNAVGNTVTQYARVTYPETIANPIFLSQMQTCNDDTVTATLRCRSVLTTEARVFKQREVSMGFTASATETAGYILINPDVIQALTTPESTKLFVYPNPVKDRLYISNNSLDKVKVDIYNLFGSLVLTEILKDNSVDVTTLNSGSYIVKISTGYISKFVKL
jgi:hypothetical protein